MGRSSLMRAVCKAASCELEKQVHLTWAARRYMIPPLALFVVLGRVIAPLSHPHQYSIDLSCRRFESGPRGNGAGPGLFK